MTYLTKKLPNGKEVGITSAEVVLPINAITDMEAGSIGRLVKELSSDYDFLKNYLCGEFAFGTIEEAKAYVAKQQQRQHSQTVKREITRQRRQEFDSKRAQLLLALIDRDGYICQYPECKVQEDLTIDHIIALSKGGSDDLENLRLLCRKHNSKKGDATAG